MDALRRLLPPPGTVRILTTSSLIASVGYGLYVTGSAVYFVRSVGLSASQVGVGLSVAAIVGFLASMPAGLLSDRLGAKRVTVSLMVLQSVTLASLTLVRGFPTFLVGMALLGLLENAANVSRAAMLAHALPSDERVGAAAYGRTAVNVGVSAGTAFCGVALQIDSRPAYLALILGNALAASVAAVIDSRVPERERERVRAAERPPAPPRTIDLPYLAVAAMTSLSRFGDLILTVALPLWIIAETDAPRGLGAWLILLNTGLVILLQVRVARGAERPSRSHALVRLSFALLVLTGPLLARTVTTATWLQIGLLVAVAALITVSELACESARWSLRYRLAPEHAQGRYSGMFSMGSTLPAFVGPALILALIERLGAGGWLVLSGLFAVALLLSQVSLTWAERSHAARESAGIAAEDERQPATTG
ncbi:MFS transporter [Micromonospora chersina]|uniref:MFS transporter n=1 Tax=Micromonospora chersina TaxID=47854 RepID=UPI0033ABDCFA